VLQRRRSPSGGQEGISEPEKKKKAARGAVDQMNLLLVGRNEGEEEIRKKRTCFRHKGVELAKEKACPQNQEGLTQTVVTQFIERT